MELETWRIHVVEAEPLRRRAMGPSAGLSIFQSCALVGISSELDGVVCGEAGARGTDCGETSGPVSGSDKVPDRRGLHYSK
jgi:hypothetical protein